MPIRRAGRPWGQAPCRLLCLPPAGAGPSLFHPWLDAAPAHIEVCPVALPGREDLFGQPLPTDLHSLADALADALAPALDRPYAVLGYSLGALLGWELVQRWRHQGRPLPQVFFALAARPPHRPLRRSEPLHALPPVAFRAMLADLGGTPPEILANADAMALFEPILRADLRLAETYVASGTTPLACPVYAFKGRDDSLLSPLDAQGWSRCSAAGFQLHELDGPHLLARPEFLAVLALAGRLWPLR